VTATGESPHFAVCRFWRGLSVAVVRRHKVLMVAHTPEQPQLSGVR